MTAAQDLVADPVGFMNENIVLVQMEGNNVPAVTLGTVTLRLWSKPKAMVRGYKRNWRRTSVGVYYLGLDPVPAYLFMGGTLDPNSFVAYFCPFKEKETHGTVVSSAANLMFTTQMDGCSLSIGSPTATGDRLIFHANAGGQPSVATNAQDTSLRANFSAANTRIEQTWGLADYRESRKGTFYKATTFGVRTPTTNTWSFYSQRYTVETGSHSISTTLGLKEIATVLA